jgi:hypothetical protein
VWFCSKNASIVLEDLRGRVRKHARFCRKTTTVKSEDLRDYIVKVAQWFYKTSVVALRDERGCVMCLAPRCGSIKTKTPYWVATSLLVLFKLFISFLAPILIDFFWVSVLPAKLRLCST